MFFFYKLSSKCFLSFSHMFTCHFDIIGSIFLTIHFKHFDFIEWFDLNFNSNKRFERSSINDLLVDSSVCFLIDYFTNLIIFIITFSTSINSNKFTIKFFLLVLLVFSPQKWDLCQHVLFYQHLQLNYVKKNKHQS